MYSEGCKRLEMVRHYRKISLSHFFVEVEPRERANCEKATACMVICTERIL